MTIPEYVPTGISARTGNGEMVNDEVAAAVWKAGTNGVIGG